VRPSSAIVASALLAIALPPARVDDRALPHAAPADVGMSAERLAMIDRVVGRGIDAGGFPGAAVIVGRHGAIVWERGYGVLGPSSTTPVDPERTLFDLASLTKVVATSAAAMVLVDEGRLGLDDPVARYLPEFRGGAKARVTIRHLLRHRAGLPAGTALGATPAESRRRVLATPLEAEPGARHEYSDLGPIVLGFVIERITGEPLDRFVRRAVYERLGMHATTFRPPRALAPRIAATARGVSRGQVHDPAAHALGDVAGHAGLFATASDLAIFAQFMLDRGRDGAGARLVGDGTVAEFTRRGPDDRQALGWETCAGGGSCGFRLSRAAFGHTGFTGTSLWIDPERDLYVIVLTNWVAGRPGGGVAPVAVLHDVRADVADLAALAAVDSAPAPMPDRLRSDAHNGW